MLRICFRISGGEEAEEIKNSDSMRDKDIPHNYIVTGGEIDLIITQSLYCHIEDTAPHHGGT